MNDFLYNRHIFIYKILAISTVPGTHLGLHHIHLPTNCRHSVRTTRRTPGIFNNLICLSPCRNRNSIFLKSDRATEPACRRNSCAA
jgi:hypothetical protein